ncbi:hypothetical protein KR51_00010230 [Rubidibacter lacunae KORDI 51-2]|uniref:Uncharacterized protein n=1 Tax=Rubidibacter lacunae KORDI 51-2 TaxID=582515 RepID=U5DKS8_9CHRO|nr:hypothetical protein [Rubidibacter lacunae]ERN42296.1 hypothetical protein KR51_00010230 [Rubidibacter lacunae KORDI 51-2]
MNDFSEDRLDANSARLEAESETRPRSAIKHAEVWSGRLAMLGVTAILVGIAINANV